MAASTSTDSTGDRIIAAATGEFARHGIAGARIERIARAARTSKERVYAYYRSKEALYRFVVARELAAVVEATRMDPTDLPGFAGRTHDHFVAHPERLRLMTWGQMELAPGDIPPDDPFYQSICAKVEQLRTAQEAGHLDPGWDPVDILTFVSQIATSWAGQTGLAPVTGDRDTFLAARRVAIVAAVQRLFPAAAGTGTPDAATPVHRGQRAEHVVGSAHGHGSIRGPSSSARTRKPAGEEVYGRAEEDGN